MKKTNWARRQRILELLQAGYSYNEIRHEVGCSAGLVTLVIADNAELLADRPRKPGGRTPELERCERILEHLHRGVTCIEAARATGASETNVRALINKRGGMLPPMKERSPLRLSVSEREELSIGLAAGRSYRQIARQLGRSPSTVCREVAANGGRDNYRAWAAERRRFAVAKRPKPAKLRSCRKLRKQVQRRLKQKHSPRQIAMALMNEFPGQADMNISHEAIYQSLFIQGRGALRRELTSCLRTGRTMRRPQRREVTAGRIKDMVMISERPPEVEDRAIPGHWEGDLIIGKDGKSAIGTLVERHTRYVMLMKVTNQKAETVREALVAATQKLPSELFKSLTWDQGKEMTQHATFSVDTGIDVYFCDPHSPWQRGSNENTNGLLRQYFPKGTSLSGHSQKDLDAVARQLNGRPRETLNMKTPAEMLDQLLR